MFSKSGCYSHVCRHITGTTVQCNEIRGKAKLTTILVSTTFISAARRQVFTAVKIQTEVFWVVTPCSVAVEYQRFGGP
jgi:hypothetical protein